ncbi:MFS transporter [Bowmanella yangjiangensis]|uniref:MFS transporter n=1 Tax=Bowmanella yangjiangensis TaxID=2811230 RepID=A0ABS3CTY4_9ALTE|nr:MFS transporter [Bowmanella yangjiangensis]MBN7819760.1 MFS transporter [Bowmanella yangjiangensis]
MTHQPKGFPLAFYVANGMEIFERLAWYGFFALSSVYMTTPAEQGGAGFSEAQRGALQGIIPFFLYLLPVVTGALGDRYGYRRMFLLSFAIMAPGYYLMGQAEGFGSFFLAMLAVACGAACFKPIVVGTIARTTVAANRGLGFGIFYTMVNIGGFLGPLVAGYMRAISWDAVFLMSSLWICLNFLPALFLYREPQQVRSTNKLSQVLSEAQQVLGNGRFAMLLFPAIMLLMAAGVGWLGYQPAFIAIAVWLVINLLWNRLCAPNARHWLAQPIRVSNLPFALYLLILTGFWTVYNQLFYTLPLFIRDYVDTGDLLSLLAWLGEDTLAFLAHVDVGALADKLQTLDAALPLEALRLQLVHLKVNVPHEVLAGALSQLGQSASPAELAAHIAQDWAGRYRQINPEYLINLDFAAIVLLQILVSYVCRRLHTFKVLVAGIVIMGGGIWLAALNGQFVLGGSLMVVVILSIAMGEMLTSPKSQEYVASIAPKQQSAMYMGYYFVSMALGFLFAGLLSGWGYENLAKQQSRPEWMWGLFALIALVSAVALWTFNRWQTRARQDRADLSVDTLSEAGNT